MAFGEKLKVLMRDQGLTQSELSALTGVGKSSISQYLSGKNEPARARKREFARALGVQDDYFEQFVPIAEVRPNDAVNVPVDLVARLMGKSKAFVTQGLQDGVFPWGYAVKLKQWSYFVSAVKFTELTGIEIPMNKEECSNENYSHV